MFTMLERSLETILSADTFALEHRDVFESSLSQLFQFSVDIGKQLVLLFFSKGTTCFTFALWHGVHSSLHAIDFQGARDIRIDLWLPDFSKEEELCTILFLMCINPEERKGAIGVQRQWQVLAVQMLRCICRTDLIVQVRILLLETAPVLLNV